MSTPPTSRPPPQGIALHQYGLLLALTCPIRPYYRLTTKRAVQRRGHPTWTIWPLCWSTHEREQAFDWSTIAESVGCGTGSTCLLSTRVHVHVWLTCSITFHRCTHYMYVNVQCTCSCRWNIEWTYLPLHKYMYCISTCVHCRVCPAGGEHKRPQRQHFIHKYIHTYMNMYTWIHVCTCVYWRNKREQTHVGLYVRTRTHCVCVHTEKNCTSGQCVEYNVHAVHHKSWTHVASFENRSSQFHQFQTYFVFGCSSCDCNCTCSSRLTGLYLVSTVSVRAT